MTRGLMRTLGKLEVHCPHRVNMVGFDNDDWADSVSPKLSSIAQLTYQMGKQATEMLLRKMQCPTENLGGIEAIIVVLKGELRIRESTAPPPAHSAS